MRKRLVLLGAATALAAGSAIAPVAESAPPDHRVTIGVRVDFSSATHASGAFVACCFVDDGGAAQADVTSFTPRDDDTARFTVTERLVGSQGTILLGLRGVTGPLSSARHVARGWWWVVRGTGAYAGLAGRGRFTAVTDEATGALTAINAGRAHRDG